MLQKTTFKLTNAKDQGTKCDYFGFSFACAKEPKGGKITTAHGFNTCREGLMGNMRKSITSPSGALQTDKMRLMFKWTASSKNLKTDLKTIEGWVNRSTAVLQAFDRMAGWPLTRVYTIECPQDWLKPYYYHSSRRWMKSSYLVSLYTLLVRMCKDERITGFKDFNGLVKKMNKLMDASTPLKSDSSYVKASLPYWEAVMKGYPRLFRQRKIEYYWDTARLSGGSGGGSEGIQYLVSGSTKYTDVRQELLKIKKELTKKSKK